MSSADAIRGPSTPESIEPPPSSRKSVLFCPECGHENHVAGDWQTRDDYVGGTRALTCPQCRSQVTERPLPRRSANGHPDDSAWSTDPDRDPWETWRDVWLSSVELVVSLSPRPKCYSSRQKFSQSSGIDRSEVGH